MNFATPTEYIRVLPFEVIEYTFGGRIGLVEFTPLASGVRVQVTFDSEDIHSEAQQREGWQAILDNFARHVEGRSDVIPP